MRTNYYQVPDNALDIGGREQQHSILDTLPLTLVTWHLVMIVRGGTLDAWRQGNRVTCAILRVKVRLIIPLYISYVRRERRQGKEEEDPAPCFHMSEICIARPENILWHCQQGCDQQQGWERKPHCVSCRETQASLRPPLTVTLTLLTLNKIYSKEYLCLMKPLYFNSSLLDEIWESQWKRTQYPIGISFPTPLASTNVTFSSSLKAFSVNIVNIVKTVPPQPVVILPLVAWCYEKGTSHSEK